MRNLLSHVVVDLTPVLPGGENGGAKIFVLELLSHLAEIAPHTQFVLLTHATTHDELAILDRTNMRRLLVVGSHDSRLPQPRLPDPASRLLSLLPAKVKAALRHLEYSVAVPLRDIRSRSLLKGLNADLLFCPLTAPTYSYRGLPTVCTVYDLQYRIYPEFFTNQDLSQRNRIFVEACRRASALAAISNYSRDSAIAHGQLDPARIRTIYLRMAQRIAPESDHNQNVLSHHGLARQRYLLYPSNFWKHKNHEMLLTAFGIACHGALPADIKLVCSGAPGERQTWLIDAARTMNLSERTLFPGYLPDAELAVLMANCSGVVFPSLYEGFGLPVIEAMAAGAPVACSNITALPEVTAGAALLFDPRVPARIAEAMITLVNDEGQRALLIDAGRCRAREFSDSKRMAREYLDLFQHALSGTQPPVRT